MTFSAAEYLASRAFPAAAAVGVLLEALAPGCVYRVQPMDTFDGAGNRLYGLLDDSVGGFAVSGVTIGQLLVWIGQRADYKTSASRPIIETPIGNAFAPGPSF